MNQQDSMVKTGNGEELLPKEIIRKMFLCGVLMTAVDGVFDQAEYEICHAFLNHYWREEFGDQQAFFEEMANFVAPLLGKTDKINQMIDGLAEELNSGLNFQEKQKLMALMKELMISDQRVTESEKELFQHLQIKLIGLPV